MSKRSHHRADGSLRPTYRRHKQRRGRAKRQAWLANFDAPARERFFRLVDLERAVFLKPFQRETGLERAEAAQLLERTAEERRWMKLRTLSGEVIGIGPSREVWAVFGGKTLYAERHTKVEAELVVEEQRELIEKFGPVVMERRVAQLETMPERVERRKKDFEPVFRHVIERVIEIEAEGE